MLKIYALLKRRAVQFSSILTNATGLYPVSPVYSPRTSRLVHHGVAGRSVAPFVTPPFGYAIHRRPPGLTALIAAAPRLRSSCVVHEQLYHVVQLGGLKACVHLRRS